MPETPVPSNTLRMRVAVRSDVGMRRAMNQDAVVATPTPTGEAIAGDHLLMVADGMGAHAAGELASKMAIQSAPLAYQKSTSDSAPDALRRAIHEANALIHAKGMSAPEFHGMGTTCSCLVVTGEAALIGHVGDSRVYRLRDGVLEQLTRDHSLVWELAAASNVTEDKVPSCIPKNVITRSLGPHESVSVDLEGPHPLADGDVFLLCSDGLTCVVDDTLAAAVMAALPPDEAVDALVHLANLRGGPDNVSAIVARVESHAAPPPPKVDRRTENHRAAIGLAAVCAVAGCWFLLREQHAGAITSAMGFAAAVTYSLIGRGWLANLRGAATPTIAKRDLRGNFGDGPYRQIKSGDLSEAAGALRELVEELEGLDSSEGDAPSPGDSQSREAAGLGIAWDPFRDRQQAANADADSGAHRDAVAGYARLVTAVMQSARQAGANAHSQAPA